MQYDLSWTALAIAGLVTGAGLVGLLVLPPWKSPLGGIAFLTGFAASVWVFGIITFEQGRVSAYVLGLVIMLGSAIGGFALASTALEQLASEEPEPDIEAPRGQDAALIVLACAEPETYSVAATARELRALSDEGSLELTMSVTPFLFAAQKARFRSVGGDSPARRQVRALVEALETGAEEIGFASAMPAWCSGSERLSMRVAEAAHRGCRRVVVMPLAVGEPAEMHRAKQALDRARPRDVGLEIAYARPLQDSDEIARLVARKIAVGIAGPLTTGVVLLAHGQPEGRETIHSEYDVNECAFVNRVRVLVGERGVPESQMLITWAEWREPGVASSVRHLAALGCDRILVAPVCFPFETLVTRIDIPLGIRQARLDPMVSVVTLSSWGDAPEVLSALLERSLEALAETARTT